MATPRHPDHYGDIKHREAVYARLRGELMRESGNRASFTRIKARVLADRDVQADPALMSMLKAFIAEREVAFAATHPANHAAPTITRTPSHWSGSPQQQPKAAVPHENILREAKARLELLDFQFHDRVLHFHHAEAEMVYGKILALVGELPEIADPARLQAFESTLNRMSERRSAFDRHIAELADRAVDFAKSGDHENAGRALKRLSSIHALHPQLLSDDRFAEVRQKIIHAGDDREHRLAAQTLIDRERAVASELKHLAANLQHLHTLARTLPHDSVEYKKAEAAYRKAVQDVNSHDTEWLAGLILELVDLLAELSDPPPEKAQAQVDRFVAGVRTALAKLRREAKSE